MCRLGGARCLSTVDPRTLLSSRSGCGWAVVVATAGLCAVPAAISPGIVRLPNKIIPWTHFAGCRALVPQPGATRDGAPMVLLAGEAGVLSGLGTGRRVSAVGVQVHDRTCTLATTVSI